MMPVPSPWDDIALPHSDFSVRQVPGKRAVPCYWGRNAQGEYLFIIELEGDSTSQFLKGRVPVNGIGVDLRAEPGGKQRLVLTLEQQVDRDVFAGLCNTLSSALENATDSPSSLAVAQAHIRRWKAFFAGQGASALSSEEVRGLFAELVFLLEMLDRYDAPTAINAWMGPERSHQDFMFGDTAVEIKSLSGTERNSVRISSEDQLESLKSSLFLRIYRLSNLADAPGARSLNAIVSEVHGKLDDAPAIEEFERKLVAHRYAPLPDYDAPVFKVSDTRTYRVADDFPRLRRSSLPAGVVKVEYDLQLEHLKDYACDAAAVFGGK